MRYGWSRFIVLLPLACSPAFAAGPPCSDAVTLGGELCDPGTRNVVAQPFDLYAKDRLIRIDGANEANGLPSEFRAYVFDFAPGANSGRLAVPVLHVPKGYPETRPSLGTIRFRLHNALPAVWNNTYLVNGLIPAGDQPLNIHTHGLLVEPHDSHGQGPYGDFVGVLGCPKSSTPSCPDMSRPMQMTEICGLAKSAELGHACPGGHAHIGAGHVAHIHGHDVVVGPVDYAIEVPGDHPASINWMHPHAHEISSPQVGAGLAAVLTVGSLCSDPALAASIRPSICETRNGEAVLKDAVRERILMLKDLQVFDRRPGGKPNVGPPFGNPDVASAEGYRVIPTCNFAKGADAIVTDGFCAFDAPDGTSTGGHWLFTVNGQIKPNVAMEAGRPELWRIANLSSNATYRLSLCRSDPHPDTANDPSLALCDDLKTFQVISLDGGLRPAESRLGDETEVLLLPGARAEIVIRPVVGETLRLVQKGFSQPDLYPPVILVKAETTAGSGQGPDIAFDHPRQTVAHHPEPTFEKPEDCETRPAALTENDWVSTSGPVEFVSVFFGRISNDPEVLTLGLMSGNPETSSDAAVRTRIANCLAHGQGDDPDCLSFMGSAFTMEHRNLCLRHGAKVTFRLFNLTGETHNFHIHQQKFEVAAAVRAPAVPPSLAAVIGSQIQRAAVTKGGSDATTSPSGAPVVDSVPVPSVWLPRKDSDPVVVDPPAEVTMRFDRPEQVGDFVFHCHILEHEDKGMMKRVTIWTRDRH